MTLGDIANKARELTHTDINSYPDANLLINVNMWYQKVVTMILESADEVSFDDARNVNYPIKTTALTTNRDYSIPVSEKVLKIKRVDVTYDGTNWFKAEPLDDGEFPYGFGSDTEIDSNFITTAPRYSAKFNSIFLYPKATSTQVANGGMMQVEWERQIIEFSQTADYNGTVMTASTTVPGFDDPFHPMLAYGAAYEKAEADQLPNLAAIQTTLTDYENRLRTAYGKKQLDRRFALEVNDGFNTYR